MARTPRKALSCTTCSAEATLRIEGKWKISGLYQLLKGTLRFNKIRRRISGATQRMLTHPRREPEADGLVMRAVTAEVPPRVEYVLSARGRSLEPVSLALKIRGDTNLSSPIVEAA